jgi:DNA (cytosine-5)-methyltransferase 1
MNYYNENDGQTASWLRELIKANLIPYGEVDERSILEVRSNDIRGFTQCHFFAGIGGWSYALQLAGWPADKPVWTGSCPCQPFSAAGKGLAQEDERHLWPAFFNLIRECRPECVFGEQVEAAIRRGWLDGISADLETEGYAVGAAVLGAHSVQSPHIRQRLYWVGNLHNAGPQGHRGFSGQYGEGERQGEERYAAPSIVRTSGVDHGLSERRDAGRDDDGEHDGIVSDSDGDVGGLGNTERNGLRERGRSAADESNQSGDRALCRPHAWHDSTVIECRDGKRRRVPAEPAFFPLAHGIPARVVRLRGYGNAIVPEGAAAFIEAFTQARSITSDAA